MGREHQINNEVCPTPVLLNDGGTPQTTLLIDSAVPIWTSSSGTRALANLRLEQGVSQTFVSIFRVEESRAC